MSLLMSISDGFLPSRAFLLKLLKSLCVPAALVVFAGCAKDSGSAAVPPPPEPVAVAQPSADDGVVRYDRYTLVSLKPDVEQQDLLSQIIDTRIPADMTPTVYQAMQHVLRQSGYALCPTADKAVATLYSRPLPAAHYRMGPVTLRSALQLLAGNAFALQVDEVGRQVCFAVREDYRKPPAENPVDVAKVAAAVTEETKP